MEHRSCGGEPKVNREKVEQRKKSREQLDQTLCRDENKWRREQSKQRSSKWSREQV